MDIQLELDTITDYERASVLMHPLRIEILKQSRTPTSATEIAKHLDLPRQKVNYHLKELAKANFLSLIEERKKRNMIEQYYVATARAYLITPEVLGPLKADWRDIQDHFSAGYLLALASQTIDDVTWAAHEAQEQGKNLSTLSMVSDIRFESAEQRAQFSQALETAIVEVIGRYTMPTQQPDDSPATGRPYRLLIGCYPIPPEKREDKS